MTRSTQAPTAAEREQMIRDLWSDRTIRHPEIARRAGISEGYLTKIARDLGLPDRRAHVFRQNQRIRIRNVEYENAQEAAAALGVSVHTVHSAVWEGREDYVGLGRSRSHNRPAPRMQKSVEIGPFKWPSHKHAAADLGISRSTLSKHLREGQREILEGLAMHHQARLQKLERRAA